MGRQILNKNMSNILTSLSNIFNLNGGFSEAISVDGVYNIYVTATYNDDYYYYQVDDNPFFDFYYSKKKILDKNKIGKGYLQKSNKEWLHDEIYTNDNLPQNVIDGLALVIFNELVNSDYDEPFVSKIRVPNIYNNSYHYEIVVDKDTHVIDSLGRRLYKKTRQVDGRD